MLVCVVTRSALLLGLIALAACSAAANERSRRDDDEVRTYADVVAGLGEVDQAMIAARSALRVSTSGVTTDGRVAKIRGRVRNVSDRPVRGIRYVVKLFAPDGKPPRELESFQYEVDTSIPSGEDVAMRLDVESMYFGSMGGVQFGILAVPKRWGDRDLELPPGWRR